MNQRSTQTGGSPDTGLVLNPATFSVKWNGKRCHLGNTTAFRCLAALAAQPTEPVENDQLVKEIDTGFIDRPNDVRVAIYRLRVKLASAEMKDLAQRIESVGGAYQIII